MAAVHKPIGDDVAAAPRDGAAPEARRFLDAIRRITREVREASREAEARLGLTAAQLYVLHQLRDSGPATISTLASRTFTHQSSVSTVVTRLEQMALVTRRPGEQDRRKVMVSLTAKADELLARAPEPVQERLLATFTALDHESRARLAGLLEAYSLRLNQDEVMPMMFEEERQEPR